MSARLLRIEAVMDAPIASAHPLHLDSIVAQAFLRIRCGGREPRAVRGADADSILHPECYIERVAALGSWVYAASAIAEAPDSSPGREYLVKRRDAIDREERARPFTIASGPDRDYLLPVPTLEAPLVRWLAIGDRRELKGILKAVRRIGGERGQGLGTVREWRIDPLDEDPASVLVRDGRAARHLPALWCVDPSSPSMHALRPPYWIAAHREAVIAAGMPCEVLPEVAAAVRALCR